VADPIVQLIVKRMQRGSPQYPAPGIHEFDLAQIQAYPAYQARQSHLLQNAITRSYGMDDIRGRTGRRLAFDENGAETVFLEPIRKDKAGNARSGNEDFFGSHSHAFVCFLNG
jgi:hypothetical protein